VAYFDAIKIARENLSPSIKPLQGLRVLDDSNFMAGPFCAMQLTEFEAEVIKVALQDMVPRLSATPGGIELQGPELGNHNREIYLELLGMTEAKLAGHQESKII
tara:strand:+ start:96163 stop:96474 length:312 start_codon:yes stop_codon:yes gene_type:complete